MAGLLVLVACHDGLPWVLREVASRALGVRGRAPEVMRCGQREATGSEPEDLKQRRRRAGANRDRHWRRSGWCDANRENDR